MAIFDKLTGQDTSTDGGGPGYKKMCLNCSFCRQDGQTVGTTNELFSCVNEKVLETGRKKIMEAVPEGFEVTKLELAPMRLKNPTKKCPNYNFDIDIITKYIKEYFSEDVDANAEKPNEK